MSIIGSGNALLLASAAAAPVVTGISRSLRFNSADSAYLSRTPTSAGNRKTWTWAGWVKLGKLSNWGALFKAGSATASPVTQLYLYSDNTLEYITYSGSTQGVITTSQVFRDPSAWYHIVLSLDTTQATANNRQRLYINGVEITAFANRTNHSQNYDTFVNDNTYAHEIGRTTNIGGSSEKYFDGCLADVHFLDGITPGTATDDANGSVTGIPNAQYLTDFGEFDATTGVWNPIEYTFGTNPNNGTTWSTATVSAGTIDGSYPVSNAFNGSLSGNDMRSSGTNTTITLTLPQSISFSNQIRFYLNQNGTANINSESTVSTSSGGANWVTVYTGSGVFSSLTLTSTGGDTVSLSAVEVDGYVLVDGTVDNSFHLTFGDNSGTSSTTLGKDAAGSNDWTPNNFSVASGSGNDSLVDVPQNGTQTDTGVGGEVRGNYCTWNPLDTISGNTFSNGNLDIQTVTAAYGTCRGTFGMSSGKWFWEVTVLDETGGGEIGIIDGVTPLPSEPYLTAKGYVYFDFGSKGNNSSQASYGASYTTGDVIGVAFDQDAGTLTFYKNGASQGTAYSGLSTTTTFFPVIADYQSANSSKFALNAGQRAFAYSAPSGFKALCTANLPTPTIEDGSAYMDVVTYAGNGSTQTISGLGFSPDFVWLKCRNSALSHTLHDTIRGVQLEIYSNSSSQEYSQPNGITAFNSDGFTLGNQSYYNGSGNTFVAWTWDAGSSTVSNTDGSITSSVRANASAGFSIVSFTGTSSSGTIGHGLGAAPGMIIVKCRSTNGTGWPVYHQSLGGVDKVVTLQSTGAVQTISNYWNSSAPSSTTFGVASGYDNNVNGATMIAYCFAPVEGYSAFGSYTGNGSTDGPFVYTGFRPRWLLIKNTTPGSTEYWILIDSARSPENVANEFLYPNDSLVEGTLYFNTDLLSNGFKLKNSVRATNQSGETYIYAAFAESPQKYARAR